MKSFQITISQGFTFTSGDPGVRIRTWGTPGQYFWSLSGSPNDANSVFNLTGFKNVDIYGVSVNGFVRGDSSSTNKCAVVTDWMMSLAFDGNAPLISGQKTISPDGFNIQPTGFLVTYYLLSKYTPSIMLPDPLKSVKNITFDILFAQGVGAEFFNSIELNYRLNFTFYYKYEGEIE